MRVIDLRGIVSYTDFFVICSGNTERQTKAIHDAIHAELKKEEGLLPRRAEGQREARWILLDYLDCVVHIFTPDAARLLPPGTALGRGPGPLRRLTFRPAVVRTYVRVVHEPQGRAGGDEGGHRSLRGGCAGAYARCRSTAATTSRSRSAGGCSGCRCKWGALIRDGSVVAVKLEGSRCTPGGYVRSSYAEDEIDLLAVYCGELDRCYLLPRELVVGRRRSGSESGPRSTVSGLA